MNAKTSCGLSKFAFRLMMPRNLLTLRIVSWLLPSFWSFMRRFNILPVVSFGNKWVVRDENCGVCLRVSA